MNGLSTPILRSLHLDARERLCRVRWLDLHLAEQLIHRARKHNGNALGEDEWDLLALACALVSYQLGQGEVCLDLQRLPARPFDYEGESPASLLYPRLTAANLSKFTCIGRPGELQPLILDGARLYLYKYWHYEQQVREALMARARLPRERLSDEQLGLFRQLFSQHTETDWQAVAVAVALLRRLAVITGGPGTGKTTTVTKLLALLAANPVPPRIRLAAPTGKAAARLTQSLRAVKQRLDIAPELAERIPEQASTLHRLLEPLPNQAQFRYNRHNPLTIDVLVLDEASMVDLPLMAKLLEALPPQSRLVLLGDPEQLASVEAGSVLADLVNDGQEACYSGEQCQALSFITGYDADMLQCAEPCSVSASPMADTICRLRTSYRFRQDIGEVARAINRQDWPGFVEACQAAEHLDWLSIKPGDLQPLVQLAVEQYRPYRTLVRQGAVPAEILQSFERCRVLAPLREGMQGVVALNKAVERALFGHQGPWYAGRPVLITRNDYNLNLYNGDIGITLMCPRREQLRVYFLQPDGVRDVAVSRLPEHDTVFAMTIHKSQGSEFDHAILVLPEQDSELLTKELLYTGVTRARHHCTLFAPEAVLRATIGRRTRRASGLRDLLWRDDRGQGCFEDTLNS